MSSRWNKISICLMLALVPLTAFAQGMTPTEAHAIAAASADHTAYALPEAKLVAAESLKNSGMVLHYLRLLWPIGILLLLLRLGVVARMRNVANNLSKNRWTQGYVFWLQLLLAMSLLTLPLEMYAHHRVFAYGLSVQGWGSWFYDQGLVFLLTYLIGGMGVMLIFLLMQKFPRRWWLPLWGAFCFFTLIGFFITPYVIDPLFNHFEPLNKSNPALVTQLERVVARGKGIDIPPERMYLMKASNKTTQINAYVTGIGASKRVVVWDTSIAKATPDEIAFIFGHEMGHYVLGHILSGILWTFAIGLVFFYLAFVLFQYLLRHFGPGWRVPAQSNWAALAVMLLAVYLVAIVEEPVQANVSRVHEHAADVYGEEVVHGVVADPQAAGQATFQVLGEAGLDAPDPSPLYVFLTASHPPDWFRAAFARAYNPWAPGEAPKYFAK